MSSAQENLLHVQRTANAVLSQQLPVEPATTILSVVQAVCVLLVAWRLLTLVLPQEIGLRDLSPQDVTRQVAE